MFRTCWAVAFVALWAAPAVAQLIHLQTLDWPGDHPDVRGVSGLELSDDGRTFTAVTDFGRILWGDITRQDGRITAWTLTGVGRLKARSGRPLRGAERDAEGLAIGIDGVPVVSFERVHRVARFADPLGPAVNIGDTDDLPDLSGNSGVEALAIHPNGTLYAMAEGAKGGSFPIYTFTNGRWSADLSLPLSEGFHVVGADFGRTGRLFILERRFRIPFFTSRIRVVDLTQKTSTSLWQSRPGAYDNLEGLTVWYDTTGQTRITLVSDDNDNWYQTTQIVEFALQD